MSEKTSDEHSSQLDGQAQCHGTLDRRPQASTTNVSGKQTCRGADEDGGGGCEAQGAGAGHHQDIGGQLRACQQRCHGARGRDAAQPLDDL